MLLSQHQHIIFIVMAALVFLVLVETAVRLLASTGRDHMASATGAARVLRKTSPSDGPLYTVDWTPESMSLPKGATAGDSHGATAGAAVPCDVRTGCFAKDRTCVHLDADFVLRGGGVLTANDSPNNGYCLSAGDRFRPQCDPRVSATALTVTGDGTARMICRCFWPTLFGQHDVFSDCDLANACGGRPNSLVHARTRVPLTSAPPDLPVLIHEYECAECGENRMSGTDPDTGLPSCEPLPFGRRTGSMDGAFDDLHRRAGIAPIVESDPNAVRTVATLLPTDSVLVSDDMEKSLVGATVPDSRSRPHLPNPCAFDYFDGSYLGDECELTASASGIAYCNPLSETVSTLMTASDYLTENNGRYANACYRFTTSPANVHAYLFEYFVREPSPQTLKSFKQQVEAARDEAAHDEHYRPTVVYQPPPLPAVTLQVRARNLSRTVQNNFGLTDSRGTLRDGVQPDDTVSVTQAPVPDDVLDLPVPLDRRTMQEYMLEYHDYADVLPAKCLFINCGAPVQTIYIPQCSEVGSGPRGPEDANVLNLLNQEHTYEELLFKTVVACRNPVYDPRLSIVPQLDVAAIDGYPYNAATLRFDKATKVVHPFWSEPYNPANQAAEERRISAYLDRLPSRPRNLRTTVERSGGTKSVVIGISICSGGGTADTSNDGTLARV